MAEQFSHPVKSTLAENHKVGVYQLEKHMVPEFENMLRGLDTGDPDDEDAFVDWARSDRVCQWVGMHTSLDMKTFPNARADYFRAPLWVAYHHSCQILSLLGVAHKNPFVETGTENEDGVPTAAESKPMNE